LVARRKRVATGVKQRGNTRARYCAAIEGNDRMRVFASLAVLAVAAVAGAPSFAQAPAAAGSVRQACAADISKLCPDAQPGNGSVRQCITAHRDQLSDGCKSALAARMAARQAAGSSAPHN
jgi:hypothetical protein